MQLIHIGTAFLLFAFMLLLCDIVANIRSKTRKWYNLRHSLLIIAGAVVIGAVTLLYISLKD